MYKFCVIIDVAIVFAMIICMVYNMYMGMNNHDTYYLVLGIIDYMVLKLSVKNIEYDIDKIDNM